MSIVASLFVLIGAVLLILGAIFFILQAFRTNIIWGLGVVFLPFVSLVFLVLHWGKAKDSFFLQLWGFGFLLVAQLVLNASLPWPGN